MTQSIVVQVGQCGNQIGCKFWDLAIREQAHYNKDGVFNDSMASFFRNVEPRSERDVAMGGKIKSMRARAVLVDMEEGVINSVLQGPLRDLFDSKQLVTDVSGSGNNWATGHKEYGSKYRDSLAEVIRHAAEKCDCLQCFFILHSMGGGTGSGLGTFVLSLLAEEYEDVYKFVTAVYPSLDDDVITSPYNTVLAMNCLTQHADCVIPVENQALVEIVKRTETDSPRSAKSGESSAFDSMNEIVANLLLHLTSSSRFQGDLNIDLNEIVMNLVPYPRMHYLTTSLAPLYTARGRKLPARRLDQTFSDAFSTSHQLLKSDPAHGLYLACALMVRGNLEVSDIRRNIERLNPKLTFAYWNQEGWKTGLCKVAPVGHTHSLLTVANNTCVRSTFSNVLNRFGKLYKRKAHLHHYLDVPEMELADFDVAQESLTSVVNEYSALENQRVKPDIPRLAVPGF